MRNKVHHGFPITGFSEIPTRTHKSADTHDQPIFSHSKANLGGENTSTTLTLPSTLEVVPSWICWIKWRWCLGRPLHHLNLVVSVGCEHGQVYMGLNWKHSLTFPHGWGFGHVGSLGIRPAITHLIFFFLGNYGHMGASKRLQVVHINRALCMTRCKSGFSRLEMMSNDYPIPGPNFPEILRLIPMIIKTWLRC